MPWFKVDDSFDMHTKAVRAGNAALGLWVRCGAYCARHLTDGFIAAEVVKLYGRPVDARALVAAGLWEAVEGGYRMHDYHDYNPTAKAVHDDRDAAKERQRKAREAAKSRRDGHVTNAVTSPEVQPESRSPSVRSPRPDPTHTSTSVDGDETTDVACVDAREHTTAGSITLAYAAGVPLADHARALRTVGQALDAGYTPDLVRRGIGVLIAEQRTCTPDALRIAMHTDEQPRGHNGRRRTATEKASQWLTVGLDDEAPPQLRAIPGGLT